MNLDSVSGSLGGGLGKNEKREMGERRRGKREGAGAAETRVGHEE